MQDSAVVAVLSPDYIDKIPDAVVQLYEQAEDDILRDMAGRIVAMDYYIPAAQWQERKLQEMGLYHDEIVSRLSEITGRSRAELNAIIKASGAEALAADADIYKAAGYNVASAAASPYLKAVIRSGMARTNNVFRNLTRTTANTATKQFENALDRAFMQVNTGAFSTQAAAQMAIKDISGSGISSITYPTGHVDSLDVAVRRAVRTGVNQSSAKITEALADEFGCDLVEVTAHFGARPTHAEWQGQVYSRSGKTPGYDNFLDATGYGTGGGLCGWNCRHSFMPYFEGTARTYSQRRLDELRDATVEYNGKRIPYYEATQIERSIERNVRKWKREYIALDAGGLPTGQAAAKISEWNSKYSAFIGSTGLKPNYANVSVQAFGRSQARQAAAAAKRAKRALPSVAKAGTMKTSALKKASIQFTPAKTAAEADAALKALGFTGQYEKGKINLDVANVVNKVVQEYSEVFGDKLRLRSIQKWPKRDASFEAAYSPAFGDVFLYKVSAKDSMARIAKTAAEEFRCGAWSTGEAEHFIRHELGHALHSGVGKSTVSAEISAIYAKTKGGMEWGKHGYTLSAYKKAGLSGEDFLRDTKKAGEVLSAYGLTSPDEMVAESVAEYMAGNPRELAIQVVNVLMGWK